MQAYICATAAMVKAHDVAQIQAQHGIDADQLFEDDEEMDSDLALSSSEWIRLQGFRDLAIEKGLLVDGVW